MFRLFFKVFKTIVLKVHMILTQFLTRIKFYGNGVEFSNDFVSMGIPIINVNLKGKFSIGKNFRMHNGQYYNTIGRQQACYFIVGKDAQLIIGNNVGVSSAAFVCYNKIVINDDVKIGGNVVIYDSDFHSLDPNERNSIPEIKHNVQNKPVIINKGAFIAAHVTILKGVEIGENSIVGAGSVVTKNIPANELWGGNPAKFLRKLC